MNIGNYKPDGNIMTVPEIKEIVIDLKDKVDTIQKNVTTLSEKVLLAGEISLQNIILYGYTVKDKRIYSVYSIPKMLDPEKTYTVDITNVTSMYVRCNGILKSFASNAEVVAGISQVLVRDGHIRFTLKSIEELPANHPITHNIEGFLTIREVVS